MWSRSPTSRKRLALAACFASLSVGCPETKRTEDAAAAPPSASAPVAASAHPADAAAPSDAHADAVAAAPVDELPDGGAGDLPTRAKHLLEAIAQDDVSLAGDIVLPREAYLTSRDAQDPGAAYDSHFKPGFESQIHPVRRREKGMDRAIFVSFDLGANPSRVTPKKKEWKDPLFRATRSTLTFTIDGRVHHLEIAEMIAWKGAWYVFKIH